MRLIFTLALLLLTLSLTAQCPDLLLSELQDIQRSDDADRENSITNVGFDLASETAATRRFNRCWRNTDKSGKTCFDQVILSNKKTGQTSFLCTDKNAFLRLRQEIEGRKGGSTFSLDQSDVYVGRMFRYEFSLQNMDGLEYYVVKISAK